MYFLSNSKYFILIAFTVILLNVLIRRLPTAVVMISAQVEVELVELEYVDRMDFLEVLGVTREGCGLRKLISET